MEEMIENNKKTIEKNDEKLTFTGEKLVNVGDIFVNADKIIANRDLKKINYCLDCQYWQSCNRRNRTMETCNYEITRQPRRGSDVACHYFERMI